MIQSFIDVEDIKHTLDLHPVPEGEPYLLGIFLVGAYQEILGDLHNLFGDTNAVHIRIDGDEFHVTDVIKGDTIEEVLSYVQYNVEKMIEGVRRQAERALREGRMSLEQLRRFMHHYEEATRSYTYLKDEL